MGIEIPEALQWAAKYVVGAGDWPEGDETAMRRMADAYTTAATTLDDLGDDAQRQVNQLLAALDGQTADAIEAFWKKLGNNDGALSALTELLRNQADVVDDGANDIEHTKLMIIAQLVIFAVEMAAALAAMATGVGAPAGAAAGAAARVATQITIRMLMKQLLQRILTRVVKEAALGALEEGGLDLGIRLIQAAKGDRELSRDDFTAVWQSAAGGAIGGAISGGHGREGGLTNGVGETAGEGLGNAVGNRAKQFATDYTTEVASDIGSQAAMAAITGEEFELSADTFTSAAAGAAQNQFDRGGNDSGDNEPGNGPDNDPESGGNDPEPQNNNNSDRGENNANGGNDGDRGGDDSDRGSDQNPANHNAGNDGGRGGDNTSGNNNRGGENAPDNTDTGNQPGQTSPANTSTDDSGNNNEPPARTQPASTDDPTSTGNDGPRTTSNPAGDDIPPADQSRTTEPTSAAPGGSQDADSPATREQSQPRAGETGNTDSGNNTGDGARTTDAGNNPPPTDPPNQPPAAADGDDNDGSNQPGDNTNQNPSSLDLPAQDNPPSQAPSSLDLPDQDDTTGSGNTPPNSLDLPEQQPPSGPPGTNPLDLPAQDNPQSAPPRQGPSLDLPVQSDNPAGSTTAPLDLPAQDTSPGSGDSPAQNSASTGQTSSAPASGPPSSPGTSSAPSQSTAPSTTPPPAQNPGPAGPGDPSDPQARPQDPTNSSTTAASAATATAPPPTSFAAPAHPTDSPRSTTPADPSTTPAQSAQPAQQSGTQRPAQSAQSPTTSRPDTTPSGNPADPRTDRPHNRPSSANTTSAQPRNPLTSTGSNPTATNPGNQTTPARADRPQSDPTSAPTTPNRAPNGSRANDTPDSNPNVPSNQTTRASADDATNPQGRTADSSPSSDVAPADSRSRTTASATRSESDPQTSPRTTADSGTGPARTTPAPTDPFPAAPPTQRTTDSPAQRHSSSDRIDDETAFSGGVIRPRDDASAFDWAEDAYDRFRADDSDIDPIAQNLANHRRADGSTFTRDDIEQIKNHLFRAIHACVDYDGNIVHQRFDANPDIAEAWIRLRAGRPLPADMVLLEHELAESTYMREHPGATYQEAHAHANESHNWSRDVPPRTGERYDTHWSEPGGTAGVLQQDQERPERGGVPVRGDQGQPGPDPDNRQGDRNRPLGPTGGRDFSDHSGPNRAPSPPREGVAPERNDRVVSSSPANSSTTPDNTRSPATNPPLYAHQDPDFHRRRSQLPEWWPRNNSTTPSTTPAHNPTTSPAHNPPSGPTPRPTNPLPPRGDEHITRAPESTPSPRPAAHTPTPARPNPTRPSAPPPHSPATPPRTPARPHTTPAAHPTPPTHPSPAPRPTPPPVRAHAPSPVNPAGARPPSATPPSRPSRWKRWFGGWRNSAAPSPSRGLAGGWPPPTPPMRRFSSDAEGHWYGEQVLGRTRDTMPAPEFRELYQYTVNSWINNFLRHPNPGQWLNDLHRDQHYFQNLAALTGPDNPPTNDQLQALANRHDLHPEQRRIIQSILAAPSPSRRTKEIWDNAKTIRQMTHNFGRPVTPDLLSAHRAGLDRALARPLPERVEVVRGLRDISFMRIDNLGTELGSGGDPRLLIGTRQTETGYMSSSLGARPPAHFDGPVRMELDVPAGTHAGWMGARSAYPDQRELILQRGTEYEITEVIENPSGDRYTGVRYLIRARVIPPGQ